MNTLSYISCFSVGVLGFFFVQYMKPNSGFCLWKDLLSSLLCQKNSNVVSKSVIMDVEQINLPASTFWMLCACFHLQHIKSLS